MSGSCNGRQHTSAVGYSSTPQPVASAASSTRPSKLSKQMRAKSRAPFACVSICRSNLDKRNIKFATPHHTRFVSSNPNGLTLFAEQTRSGLFLEGVAGSHAGRSTAHAIWSHTRMNGFGGDNPQSQFGSLGHICQIQPRLPPSAQHVNHTDKNNTVCSEYRKRRCGS